MTVKLNHTIVPVREKATSARFLADVLDNEVTLDYIDVADPRPQHYAFLVSEDVFDAGFARVTAAGIAYHADPNGGRQGQTYTNQSGGRGFYFADPDGHLMELLTRAPEPKPPDQTGGGGQSQRNQPSLQAQFSAATSRQTRTPTKPPPSPSSTTSPNPTDE